MTMIEMVPSISDNLRCTPTTVTMIITLIVIGILLLAILWCCYYCCCKSCKRRTSLPFRPKPQIKQRNNSLNTYNPRKTTCKPFCNTLDLRLSISICHSVRFSLLRICAGLLLYFLLLFSPI